ncbi:hypothetical protein AB3R30_06470 [Leptolyngbyaceae cyanobacterium UHCC 1019]
MNQVKTIAIAGAISLSSGVIFINVPAIAQTCTALPVVDGSGTLIQKSVSPPGTGITRNNWSTDFVVPSSRSFRRYVTRIVPKNGGEYDVAMSLKYNNDTADSVFTRTLKLSEQKPYTIQGSARNSATPYQVNVSVGGLRAIGNAYTVLALGCN